MTDQKSIKVMHSKNLNTEKTKGKVGKIAPRRIDWVKWD